MRRQGSAPRIDVWGSCVSRDTLEYMPDVEVGVYVARQSAIVSLEPAREIDIPYDRLESDFQKRMLTGDVRADVTDRLGGDVALVLIDLVDERRGVWEFPSSGYLTNSVEAFKVGIEDWGPQQGARLIEFGTDEHFDLWRNGFVMIMRQIGQSRIPVVLLDIAWAEVAEGQRRPHGLRTVGGSIARRLKRGSRTMSREIIRGEPFVTAVRGLVSPAASKAEELAAESQRQNRNYRRYVEFAERMTDATIQRSATSVRMDPRHKWGLGPYHYRRTDYEEIAERVRLFVQIKEDRERRKEDLKLR